MPRYTPLVICNRAPSRSADRWLVPIPPVPIPPQAGRVSQESRRQSLDPPVRTVGPPSVSAVVSMSAAGTEPVPPPPFCPGNSLLPPELAGTVHLDKVVRSQGASIGCAREGPSVWAGGLPRCLLGVGVLHLLGVLNLLGVLRVLRAQLGQRLGAGVGPLRGPGDRTSRVHARRPLGSPPCSPLRARRRRSRRRRSSGARRRRWPSRDPIWRRSRS